MPLHTIPLPKVIPAAANVLVTNSNAAFNWMILIIERVGQFEYPGIALKRNSTKNLNLAPGTYHFFFTFENLTAPSTADLQVFSPNTKSPFPAAPKSVGAVAGQRGQTGITVTV